MEKPSKKSLVIGCIPFVAVCFSVCLWDRVEPAFLGIPFNICWLTVWNLLAPVLMWQAYKSDRKRRGKNVGGDY